MVEQWDAAIDKVVEWRRDVKTVRQTETFRKKPKEYLYLGGAPENDVGKLTGYLYTKSFWGCISHLEIRKRTPRQFGGVVDFKTRPNNKNIISRAGVSCKTGCFN